MIATLSLLASAATAGAECAWVLWATSGDAILPMDGFKTREECNADKAARSDYMKKEIQAGRLDARREIPLLCLPDTVDPRGPKGGGR